MLLTLLHEVQTSSASLHPSITHNIQHKIGLHTDKQTAQLVAVLPALLLMDFILGIMQNKSL